MSMVNWSMWRSSSSRQISKVSESQQFHQQMVTSSASTGDEASALCLAPMWKSLVSVLDSCCVAGLLLALAGLLLALAVSNGPWLLWGLLSPCRFLPFDVLVAGRCGFCCFLARDSCNTAVTVQNRVVCMLIMFVSMNWNALSSCLQLNG